jgi:hypothetical protein
MTGVAYVRMSAMKPNMVEVDSQRRMECRKKECSSLSVRISKLDIGEELDRYRQVSYLLSGRGSRIR